MKLPFMGRKKTAAAGGRTAHEEHLGKPATAKGRTLLLLSQLLIFLGVACLVVGAALLQHQIRNQSAVATSAAGSYNDVLQSAHVPPYSGSHRRQWEMLWWIVAGQFFVWILTLLLVIRAARIVQWGAALVGLHIYFLVLATWMIDALLFLDRTSAAQSIFNHNYIRVALAGLFGIAGGDGLAVLALGMISSTKHIDARHNTGYGERTVAPVSDYGAQQPASGAGLPMYKEAPVQQGAHDINAPHLRTDVP